VSQTLYRAAVKLETLLYGVILLLAATDDGEPSDHDLLAGPLQVACDAPSLHEATWTQAS
jgi:hypothetical protein